MKQIAKNIPIEERIKSNIVVDPESGCWLWQGTRHKKGYGIMGIGSAIFKAHRVSYKWFRGDIPEGMHVCHKCDNPPCCNPEHLFVGTNQDNAIDAMSKGRLLIPRGEKQGSSKLTESEVREIRKLWEERKFTQTQLAKMFNTPQANVSAIVLRKAWAHVR